MNKELHTDMSWAAYGFRARHLERSSLSQEKGLQAHTEELSVTQELGGLPAGLENTAARLTWKN